MSRNDGEAQARRLVFARDRNRCARCASMGRLEFSHRRSRSVSDNHKWCACNATAVCAACHRWMHANPGEAKRQGWHVSSFESTPAVVPIELVPGKWSLLQCNGEMVVLHADEVMVGIDDKPQLTDEAVPVVALRIEASPTKL